MSEQVEQVEQQQKELKGIKLSIVQEVIRRQIDKATLTKPVWPDRYADERDWKCLRNFCWERLLTYNEADQSIELIPRKDYIEWLIYNWHDSYINKTPTVWEKSRRMIVSWLFRGCELWAMGLRRGNAIVCDQDYDQSAKHCWRYHHYMVEMKRRFEDMRHVNYSTKNARGEVAAYKCDAVLLPNGSIMSNANQDGKALQGEGKSIISLEELSRYKHPASIWAQAKILTQGKAGSRGGFINAITNASPNDEWRSIKGNLSFVAPGRCEVRESALLS